MSGVGCLPEAAAKLERVANLATPGPWQRTPSGAVYHHHPEGGTTGVTHAMARGTDAAFLTTMDPTVAVAAAALLREIDTKHGQWVEDPQLCGWCPSVFPCPDYIAASALAAAVLGLPEDNERTP